MRYLSQCPNCHTLYHLSFMDINVGSGRLKCASCQHIYDVYSSFVENKRYEHPQISNYMADVVLLQSNPPQPLKPDNLNESVHVEFAYVHHLIHAKIPNSPLDLYNYLNYIEMLNPIHSDNLLNDKKNRIEYALKKPVINKNRRFTFMQDYKKLEYYYFWGISIFILFTLLVFQILLFND